MKVIGTVPVCGVDYEVKVGDFSDFQPLELADGVCDPTNRVIWIQSGLSPEKVLSVLKHECLHALFHESGMMQMTEAALGTDKLDAWEEALVRILTPHIDSTFGPPQLQRRKGRAR